MTPETASKKHEHNFRWHSPKQGTCPVCGVYIWGDEPSLIIDLKIWGAMAILGLIYGLMLLLV